MSRESLLARTMVELADTLVDDFDIVDLLSTLTSRCVEVLDVAAAGILLVGPDGALRAVSSSSEAMRIVELFELQSEEGPCLDCYRSGQPTISGDLAGAAGARWPLFAPVAVHGGFRVADAVPMRLRGTIIGALNLFGSRPESLGGTDLAVAQALADVATIAILQHRATVETKLLNEQLNIALNSRIVIEQAKGMVAEHQRLDMEGAFGRLRTHARNHNVRLADVAAAVTSGALSPADLDPPR